jgi:hypothetical protein
MYLSFPSHHSYPGTAKGSQSDFWKYLEEAVVPLLYWVSFSPEQLFHQ